MNDRMPKITTFEEWQKAAAKSAGSPACVGWTKPR